MLLTEEKKGWESVFNQVDRQVELLRCANGGVLSRKLSLRHLDRLAQSIRWDQRVATSYLGWVLAIKLDLEEHPNDAFKVMFRETVSAHLTPVVREFHQQEFPGQGQQTFKEMLEMSFALMEINVVAFA